MQENNLIIALLIDTENVSMQYMEIGRAHV